jgi:fructosamine-3-kinase
MRPLELSEDNSVHRFLAEALRIRIEKLVSSYLSREWGVSSFEDKADFASHPAAILSDGTYSIFVKLGEGELALDQFEKEIAGLRLLTEFSGVLTPAVIGEIKFEGGAILVMEAVKEVRRKSIHWRQIGQALAQIHQVKGKRFGFETHCYWGSILQDNSEHDHWPEFFWERRMAPRLKGAVDSGNLPINLISEIEKLGADLHRLCGPEVRPALLHGDAQQNNFLSTNEGPYLIDPSVHYGHPEMDLAYVDFFAPVSEELYQGYDDVAPVDSDFNERRDLWLIPAWLAMIEVEGPAYLDGLLSALRNYV